MQAQVLIIPFISVLSVVFEVLDGDVDEVAGSGVLELVDVGPAVPCQCLSLCCVFVSVRAEDDSISSLLGDGDANFVGDGVDALAMVSSPDEGVITQADAATAR